jgi:hypothetical protein
MTVVTIYPTELFPEVVGILKHLVVLMVLDQLGYEVDEVGFHEKVVLFLAKDFKGRFVFVLATQRVLEIACQAVPAETLFLPYEVSWQVSTRRTSEVPGHP